MAALQIPPKRLTRLEKERSHRIADTARMSSRRSILQGLPLKSTSKIGFATESQWREISQDSVKSYLVKSYSAKSH
jgi:hypothetical protein